MFKQHVPKSSDLDRTDGKTPNGYNTSDSGPSNKLNTYQANNINGDRERESILKGLFADPEFPIIPESQQQKIDLDEPLITSIQNVIDQKLGQVYLNDEDIKTIIQIVNNKDLTNWWNIGWDIKCEMLKQWLEKYKEIKNIHNLNEKDQIKLTQKMNIQDKAAEKKIEEWSILKNNN